jgi:hypothetical protein
MTDRDPSAAGDHAMILVEARSPVAFSETTHRRAIATGDFAAWQASTVPTQCGNTARRTVGGTARQRDEVARLVRQHQAQYDVSAERRGHEGLRHQRPCAGRRRLAA